MQFVVIAEHAPELCPTSNAKTRQMMKQGTKDIPDLAKKLGVKIITMNVFGPDHVLTLSLMRRSTRPKTSSASEICETLRSMDDGIR